MEEFVEVKLVLGQKMEGSNLNCKALFRFILSLSGEDIGIEGTRNIAIVNRIPREGAKSELQNQKIDSTVSEFRKSLLNTVQKVLLFDVSGIQT